MKSIICALVIAWGSLFSKEIDKVKMSTKIVQVEIKVGEKSTELESIINKFLIERKIKQEDLIDIKFISGEYYRRAMIVYLVDFEDLK